MSWNDAKRRGDIAAKLFADELDKVNPKKFMNDIIKAIDKEEKHSGNLGDPSKPSGRDDFFVACYDALPVSEFNNNEAERAAFVQDLWNATWGSRRAQQAKACW